MTYFLKDNFKILTKSKDYFKEFIFYFEIHHYQKLE